MKQYEEQDRLIEEGISMICNKITETLELLFEDNHDKHACCKMSREWQIKHHSWQEKFFDMHARLSAWELQFCKIQTFSVAFEPLITFLMMNKAVKQKASFAMKEAPENLMNARHGIKSRNKTANQEATYQK